MDVAAVIVALYGAIQVVDNLYQFGQAVAFLFGLGSDGPSLAQVEIMLQQLRNQVQQSSAQILAAVAAIDQSIFKEKMAEQLALADQAGDALARWQQEQTDLEAREEALDKSGTALAQVVEFYSGAVFPGTPMVLVLARVLLARLAVLGTFPDARTADDTAQLKQALDYLTQSIEEIAAAIQSAAPVKITTTEEHIANRPPINFWEINVHYANLQGDQVYDQTANGRTLAEAQAHAAPLINAADQVAAQGLAEDLDHAQVTSLRHVAHTVEQAVG